MHSLLFVFYVISQTIEKEILKTLKYENISLYQPCARYHFKNQFY
ncbi:hypothetical protein DDD_1032 [Nonlabens dokdonensis DSW-6]|uniref:Uncharacterized protein n=1 Tax=Nonlabens dokdonensis (strain DSM 17205 / KCTC 12402 / DSW-6) TaxID=592029 RepID=L7W7N2_NONDD|nr:hypothetical protein DDD_1032 [Nonlabens dokdonensis DSW-6]